MNNENKPVKELPAQALPEDVLMEYKYLQALCSMTRGVTHDYNNIFTGLSGQLKLITQDAVRGGIAEHRLEMINDLLTRGSNRTSILYEFSRYTSTAKAEHSLDRILELAVESLNTLSRTHRFVVEKSGELPRLHCHPKDLVMMLFYLGENGLEAMPEGGTIGVLAEADRSRDEAVVLSVRDRGKGVSAEVRGSLLEPFVTTKPAQQGLRGLGLYAAEHIARQHGGCLSFSDDNGQGTVFSARIPLTRLAVEKSPCSEQEKVAPSAPRRKEFGRSRETFLVIEDDEAMRDLIVNGLQRRGHVVFSAETCGEALEDFEFVHEAVTVLLIDIGLTDSDGFECLNRMRKISSRAKVILMSGEDVGEQQLISCNAAYLRKPFTVKEIEQLVSHVK